MEKLIAFHGKPEIKELYLARVRAHREADEIIHGIYWANEKGCAVGCTIHSGDHKAYENELGIPQLLAHLEDGIFESLANGRALSWPEEFISAINVGADLSLVWKKFTLWSLLDPKWGMVACTKDIRAKAYIQAVGDQYQVLVDGGTPDWSKSDDLWRDAWAAWVARDAWAARAARAAWDAWAAWVARAAWDARVARAAWDAKEYPAIQANKLIELLKAEN